MIRYNLTYLGRAGSDSTHDMPVRDLDESSVSCSIVTRLVLSTGGREEGSMAAMATVVFLYSYAKYTSF